MSGHNRRDLLGRLDRLRRALGAQIQPAAAISAAEAQASRAEMRLREALDVLPEGIVFLDAEGRYVLWNKKYAEIYHRSADLFREGVRLADTLAVGVHRGDYPEAVGREDVWLKQRLALLDQPGQRHQQRLADGRWVMIEERKTADGGTIGIRIDITEMKEQAARLEAALAQAQAANRTKGEFLANMSHEIRTPLNGVLGLADVLSRTNLDDSQRRLLSTIMASANDLNVLLADLLDFSRLEAGKIEIAALPIAIGEVVHECAALFRGNAAKKGLVLAASVAPDADAVVLGDRTRIKQVLTNLLSNAVKFTETGAVELNLLRDRAGGYCFQVRDTGVGFDNAAAARLFERFEQEDGSTTRRFGGAGLGLSICKQLTELMGGAISAHGAKGQGAVFTVVLPLPAAVLPDEDDDRRGRAQSLRILAVDDNPTNLKVVELMLESIGAQVATAENGAEAVEAVALGDFDVVLMDMQMPVMDGLSATRVIRETAGAPPVIMISANNSPDDRAASASAGVCAHIGKPFRVEDLVSSIMTALDARALVRVA
jgi:signal transduction histidine kinase/ActR/RegA family two-component response regulator